MAFKDKLKIPKGADKYFSPKQEKLLKEKYGKLYTVHTLASIIILLLPPIAFLFFIPPNALEPATQGANLLAALGGILGLIGSFSIGIGFVNVFQLLVKQYLGHYVTFFSILIGAVLDGLALLIFMAV